MGNLNICFAYKRTIQNILKLGVNSSPSVVYFVAGSLPGTAILELKQLTLFGMVCRLPTNPINIHAKQILLSAAASHSWYRLDTDFCWCQKPGSSSCSWPPSIQVLSFHAIGHLKTPMASVPMKYARNMQSLNLLSIFYFIVQPTTQLDRMPSNSAVELKTSMYTSLSLISSSQAHTSFSNSFWIVLQSQKSSLWPSNMVTTSSTTSYILAGRGALQYTGWEWNVSASGTSDELHPSGI